MSIDSGEHTADGKNLYRRPARPVASIRVLTETESRSSWEFEVEVTRSTPAGDEHRTIRVTLAFADYEYWCHGTTGPAKVIEALMGLLADRESPLLLRDAFDAARSRREHPGIDRVLVQRL